VNILCEVAGMSRQNFYSQRKVRQKLIVDEQLILDLVRGIRHWHPKMGSIKILHLIKGELNRADVTIGRDRFFSLLRRYDLLLPRKTGRKYTTDSRHGFKVYSNLAKTMTVNAPHQLWVSDITYIRTLEGFMYLCLIMDVYSRAIVGWDCSDSLEMEGSLRALKMALKQLPGEAKLVHHSDCGIQYCCGGYVKLLNDRHIAISMTEENHCYENGKAERLNKTLKYEYGLGRTFAQKSQVNLVAESAIMLYNRYRPHLELNLDFPMAVHKAA